uniref:Uncharacterized protein n=1 Tax=Romanomermis culicivorax TaxID=13658 RepID=A0A915K4H7_ROMCU
MRLKFSTNVPTIIYACLLLEEERVFEKYPDIKRFLVSAAIYDENKNLSFIDDNVIDLTGMQTIEERSRAMPDIKKDRADQMIQLKDFVGPWKKEKMRKMSDFWISMLDLG